MKKTIFNKGVISIYIVSMLLTYVTVVRIDNLNNQNITTNHNQIVYIEE